ncbi:MAG TPA: hypothetical protein VFV95_18880 [Vicinamibacterales bacterium]|nr:hypothetical protein [Vicinamibacterales bacterium]
MSTTHLRGQQERQAVRQRDRIDERAAKEASTFKAGTGIETLSYYGEPVTPI